MSIISREELEKNDGRGGNPAFVAVNGEVYDISASPLWKDGEHMGEHYAGCDMTEAMERAPHGIEKLERYQKVGELEPVAETGRETAPAIPWWASITIFMRAHPMFVHFPQALFVLAPVFLTLFYTVKFPDFERTAFFLMIAGFLTAIPATISGFIHWRYKFSGKSRLVFKLKIVLSLLLILLAAVTVGVHIGKGKLSFEEVSIGMLLLYWVHLFIAAALGKAGGNIVFGRRK
ncbi:MAG: hypothetical protein FWF13_01870 [Acidobacteria bacterium]|nr:hypothetical protein [Acidobacteriota bacterium]